MEAQLGMPSFGAGGGLAMVESTAARELPMLRRAWKSAVDVSERGDAGRAFEAWAGRVLNLEKNTLSFKGGIQVPGGTRGAKIPDFFVSGINGSIVEIKSASFSIPQAKEFARVAVQQGRGLTYVFLKNPGPEALKALRAAVASVDENLEIAINVVFP